MEDDETLVLVTRQDAASEAVPLTRIERLFTVFEA